MRIKLGGAWFRTEGSGRVTVLSRSGRPLRPRTSLGASRRPKTRAVSGLHWGAGQCPWADLSVHRSPALPVGVSLYHTQVHGGPAGGVHSGRRGGAPHSGSLPRRGHWHSLPVSSKLTGRACTERGFLSGSAGYPARLSLAVGALIISGPRAARILARPRCKPGLPACPRRARAPPRSTREECERRLRFPFSGGRVN